MVVKGSQSSCSRLEVINQDDRSTVGQRSVVRPISALNESSVRGMSCEFGPDSPLEEGVSSEPVSEARPYWRLGEASTRGGGAIKKLGSTPCTTH
jgi:hypothetical protein